MNIANVLFFLAAFLMGFAACIMPGPVAIEVFHHALRRQSKHALSVGLGAAIGDAIWAMVAFYGITPFLKNNRGSHLEGIFLLAAAAITFIVGMLALKDARLLKKVEETEEKIVEKTKVKRKRWSFVKGFSMMMVNPLGIGSWVIVLSFLKKSGIYIPLELSYEIFFFLFVTIGAFSYSILMVAVTNRLKALFDPGRTAKITRGLGYLLISFSVYFLFFALRSLLFI